MLLRWRMVVVLWCLLLAVAAEEAPPGLVSKDSEQDLVAEASHTGTQTQKREAGGLSNSYGEPLPPDAYGPPREISNIIPDLQLPAPIYGVPLPNVQETPPGAYGPPSPVVFPDQNYEGPPPPISRPKPLYGPPKNYGPPKSYGPPKFPPKLVYGPPKKIYGPPKQSLPKPTYGAPFKSPKVLSKPFGKPIYGPPKLKPTYGPPILKPIPLEPPPPAPTVTTIETSVTNFGNVGASFGSFNGLSNIGSNIDLGLNLPAPIYGTPIVSLPVDLKPNFPIPAETYGPPGHSLGPIGPNDQVVLQDFSNVGHYGPPQPDPNPRPPHPGIPAPPTPPHVLYDGWKPIPGLSYPVGHVEEVLNIGVGDNYGPPPPPPGQEIHVQHQIGLDQLSSHIGLDQQLSHIGLDQHLTGQLDFNHGLDQQNHISFDQHLPNVNQLQSFSNAQIASGYSNVHQDALAHVDLGSIVGGDSNHIDQSKTVFEAHYTENQHPQSDLAFVQSAITLEKPADSYGAPPLDSLSGGPYPASLRQQGAKGLVPPSGVYGVPPGSQYGAPHKPTNLPIPYGSFSGGGHSIHTGGNTPKHPVKFRESVPQGLLEHIGQTTHGKDTHGINHLTQGPAYLPPPIRDAKDVNQQTSLGINLSIEPSSLYSLPHAGSPMNFQSQPGNLYGSPIDSYSAPLLTVGDHTASGSSNNAITTTIDGTLLANLSSLDAAAILKHCPYHEAIFKAAKYGEKIPIELANKYMASLNSLGHHLTKTHFKDQATSQTIVQVKDQTAKSIRDANIDFKNEKLQYVSDQILKTSEKIRNLSEETKNLQQKLTSNNLNNVQFENGKNQYSVQIEASGGKKGNPAIPHDQLLSEGLLQSILQAIEQPGPNQSQKQFGSSQKQEHFPDQNQVKVQFPEPVYDGLVLPAGYEPVDRTKDLTPQGSEVKHVDCVKAEGSAKVEVVVPPPDKVNDNEVAIFFDKDKEPVTEISVATSISEKEYDFGKKI
ncbi:hypothetical protein O3G_MSEX012728 [Manduca sexta]|uniref:Uncharacterized protein n=1 Tax=Manduca sexta TaxID=7130 RepID=A0A921ZP12_MANSE|nr:hypothetical protein O3G_MSEX012728 [Manduca sexta]